MISAKKYQHIRKKRSPKGDQTNMKFWGDFLLKVRAEKYYWLRKMAKKTKKNGPIESITTSNTSSPVDM